MPRTANESSASLVPIDERADSRSQIPDRRFGEDKKNFPQRSLPPDAPHGRGPLGTVTTASTVDFQGPPPPQPSPPSPPSPLPPFWPQPPALPSVATCGSAFRPSRPQCKKKLGMFRPFLGPSVELERHLWCIGVTITLLLYVV